MSIKKIISASLVFGLTQSIVIAGESQFKVQKLNIFIDSIEVTNTKTENGQSIIFNGEVYLPAKTLANGFKKPYYYEGKSSSVYLGSKPVNIESLENISPFAVDYRDGNYSLQKFDSFTSNTGVVFNHGYTPINEPLGWPGMLGGKYAEFKLKYLLNSNYKNISFEVAPSIDWTSDRYLIGREKICGEIKVVTDDNVVFEQKSIKSDESKNLKISLDITGANTLILSGNLRSCAIVNPILSK